MKNDINEQRRREHEHLQAADHSKLVLNSIKSTIIDLILKLQEIDEAIDPMNLGGLKFELLKNPFADLSHCENISNDVLLQVSECSFSTFFSIHERLRTKIYSVRVGQRIHEIIIHILSAVNDGDVKCARK